MNLFGSGTLWGSPIQDANGNPITNPTPIQFGVLQEVSVDISFDNKLLYGQLQFAVDSGRGKGKISCKAKAAQVNAQLFNSIFFGQALTSGVIADYLDLIGTVIPGTPFNITPPVPGSGVWTTDLGVRGEGGSQFIRVASAPTTGQYAVNAGQYTFAGADVGKRAYMSFQYTGASSVAQKSMVTNMLMGAAPTFRADISVQRGLKSMILSLMSCTSSKLSFTTKQDDFIIPEFDFDGMADANGNVLQWAMSE